MTGTSVDDRREDTIARFTGQAGPSAPSLNSWLYFFLVSLIGYLLKADVSTLRGEAQITITS